jgi:hypothetical protein
LFSPLANYEPKKDVVKPESLLVPSAAAAIGTKMSVATTMAAKETSFQYPKIYCSQHDREATDRNEVAAKVLYPSMPLKCCAPPDDQYKMVTMLPLHAIQSKMRKKGLTDSNNWKMYYMRESHDGLAFKYWLSKEQNAENEKKRKRNWEDRLEAIKNEESRKEELRRSKLTEEERRKEDEIIEAKRVKAETRIREERERSERLAAEEREARRLRRAAFERRRNFEQFGMLSPEVE